MTKEEAVKEALDAIRDLGTCCDVECEPQCLTMVDDDEPEFYISVSFIDCSDYTVLSCSFDFVVPAGSDVVEIFTSEDSSEPITEGELYRQIACRALSALGENH